MSKFGFCGPSYVAQSPKFANERAVNLYCETAETENGGKGGSKTMLIKVPGRAVTHTLPDNPLRCLYSGDGIRVFAVSGATLYELFEDGTFTDFGITEANGATPAQIFSNGNQLLVVSGTGGFVPDPVAHTCARVVDICQGGYLDGYGIGVEGPAPGDSKTFRISNILDFNIWDDLDFANVDQSPDNIQALVVDHRQLIFLKQQTGVFYWDSGNPDFPIEPVQGSNIEQGCIAPWSLQRIDNTVMWLGGDERGAGVVWRMQGYTPQRVSTYAVENAIQGYTRVGITIRDAVACVIQQQGHTFYLLSFPSANATWVYDTSTNLWHERLVWNSALSIWNCDRARYHCYAWGMHLVGGGDGTGKVYNQSETIYDDAGIPLRWLRGAPHIADAGSKTIFFSNLFLDFQIGVGNTATPDPQIIVRHSNDGGNTWNPETQLPVGKVGQYSCRVRQIICGSGRDRNIEVSGSDGVITAIVDADIKATVGIS